MSELQQVKTYDIVLIPIDQIKTDPDNPNIVSGAAMQALRESMRKFGYLEPIVVDQNNKIANGEHRFEIYKEFGETKIPAIVVTLKSDAERRLLRQAMNKIHGSHDPFKDAKEFGEILKADKTELDFRVGESASKLLFCFRAVLGSDGVRASAGNDDMFSVDHERNLVCGCSCY